MEITSASGTTDPFEEQIVTSDAPFMGEYESPEPYDADDESEDEVDGKPEKSEKENDSKKKDKPDNSEGEEEQENQEDLSMTSLKNSSAEMKLEILIKAGLRNIWMVGPAGCGKTTITRTTAKKMNIPCYVVSCGLGTSAAEFNGYKYPSREKTPFAEYYCQPSIILLDEFSALDPSVAQVANSALANGILNTTTGIIERHPECIIVATSNTFGTGADRQYVANNQLDSSTIDRFVGGIMEVNYSYAYESQFDSEVVDYAALLRLAIEKHALRRVASTRMIIEGDKLKKFGVKDWQEHLIVNWSKAEKRLLSEFIAELEKMEEEIKKLNAIKQQEELGKRRQKEIKEYKLHEVDLNLIKTRVSPKETYVKVINREESRHESPYIVKSRSSDFKLYCDSLIHAKAVLAEIKKQILKQQETPMGQILTTAMEEWTVSGA